MNEENERNSEELHDDRYTLNVCIEKEAHF